MIPISGIAPTLFPQRLSVSIKLPDIPQLDSSVEGARRKALLSTAQADPRNPLSAGADGADEFNRHAIIALDNNRVCDFRTPDNNRFWYGGTASAEQRYPE